MLDCALVERNAMHFPGEIIKPTIMAAGVEEDFTQRINLLQAQDDEKLKWLKVRVTC